ncbi:hypothetical protein HAX54_050644 [Datura stramonium]|uniref:Putative plant transposon protein domain-containing protein n=1 Tax=Datura stramonium TaxID=4076 RepID=A0ABS8RQV8_DATST|nr:hypothetical protein [Datura stramonium]
MCLIGMMTSTGNKKQQEAVAQKEIAKRQQLHDESKSDSSSGSEAHYNIENSYESPFVTTREKYKAREATVATTSPPQLEEGDEEAESDGNNPPADNEEEGNDDAEESWIMILRDMYYAGLSLNDKGNPSRSIQEDPKIQINALNEVPELKRLFEGYNMYWTTKTLGKYNMEMVHEFYTNYYCTLEKKAPSKNVIKKEPVLDSLRVRVIPVDISEKTITRFLMDGDYTVPTQTTEYDYRMEEMKGIRKLSTEDKVMLFQWRTNINSKDKEGSEWVIGRKPIYKASLNFLAKSWWSIVRHRLASTVNDKVLRVDKAALVA